MPPVDQRIIARAISSARGDMSVFARRLSPLPLQKNTVPRSLTDPGNHLHLIHQIIAINW